MPRAKHPATNLENNDAAADLRALAKRQRVDTHTDWQWKVETRREILAGIDAVLQGLGV